MEAAAPKVLLVEDEPLVLRTTAALFEDDGFEVAEARGYDDALERLAGAPETDVLVTDINLAGRADGLALANAVAERWPHIRIVIVSGCVRPAGAQYPERAIFFTKPYAPRALLTIVRDPSSW
ncbi:MAG TPA: response regulator [Allosphingosinicella sp.]